MSEAIAQRVELVPLSAIYDDPLFENLRLTANPEALSQLCESMSREGLKVPIELVERQNRDNESPSFCARAGFRRLQAARLLKWQQIPAIILPPNTPVVDEYWTNIIENSARDKLSTFEIAHAAATMRDKFRVSSREFALKAGYSETYIANLLRCYDHLPPEIIDEWRAQAPIPIDLYVKWSSLSPTEALREMLTYCGRHPQVTRDWTPSPGTRQKVHPARMASSRGLARMQRLRIAVEVARSLDEKTRTTCLHLIDYCTGARENVPLIYDSSSPQQAPRTRRSKPQD